MEKTDIKISEEYGKLVNVRKTYTEMAEKCAELTLPYAFTAENFKSQDTFVRNYT